MLVSDGENAKRDTERCGNREGKWAGIGSGMGFSYSLWQQEATKRSPWILNGERNCFRACRVFVATV